MKKTVKNDKQLFTEKASTFTKCVIVGDTRVGKTTLLESFAQKKTDIKGYSVCLPMPFVVNPSSSNNDATGGQFSCARFMDLRSQRYFPIIHSIFYNNAEGGLLVFDVMRTNSLLVIQKWVKVLFKMAGTVPLLLCGNKADLRQKSNEQGISRRTIIIYSETLMKEVNRPVYYIELSAKERKIYYSNIPKIEIPRQLHVFAKDGYLKPFIQWLSIFRENKNHKITVK
jgi:small GTP-binding protein